MAHRAFTWSKTAQITYFLSWRRQFEEDERGLRGNAGIFYLVRAVIVVAFMVGSSGRLLGQNLLELSCDKAVGNFDFYGCLNPTPLELPHRVNPLEVLEILELHVDHGRLPLNEPVSYNGPARSTPDVTIGYGSRPWRNRGAVLPWWRCGNVASSRGDRSRDKRGPLRLSVEGGWAVGVNSQLSSQPQHDPADTSSGRAESSYIIFVSNVRPNAGRMSVQMREECPSKYGKNVRPNTGRMSEYGKNAWFVNFLTEEYILKKKYAMELKLGGNFNFSIGKIDVFSVTDGCYCLLA
ncbi:hypothetical protein J6590_025059 [Homalodisca vitripennis]|nr:hypothetical protein J6590_025059 [Homalodisca vitripennis]